MLTQMSMNHDYSHRFKLTDGRATVETLLFNAFVRKYIEPICEKTKRGLQFAREN